MKVTRFAFKKPIDFHCHFRQGKLLKHLVGESARYFKKALAMPNTTPPILTPEDVTQYGTELRSAAAQHFGGWWEPSKFDVLLTFKIIESTDPNSIAGLKAAGAVAGKLYPGGVTTNSEDGVKDFKALYPVFDEMQKHDVVLCVHAEMPGSSIETAEEDFLPILSDIIDAFPTLRIVFEHISTAAGVEFIQQRWGKYNRHLSATVTPHHLLLTHDDVFKEGKVHNPHHFCKPVCKTKADRTAIRGAVLHDCHPAFFLGTDSAPHPDEAKQKDSPNAGVYNVGTSISLLVDEFIMADSLSEFELFTSIYGERFYQLDPHDEEVEYIRQEGTVIPEFWEPYAGMKIKPLGAGQEITWRPEQRWGS